jgi:biotin transport system substrate-specific component
MSTGTVRAPFPPLVDRLVPSRLRPLRVAVQVVAGITVLAALAQVRIEIGPVPITGQTLGVLLIAAAYGLRLGTLTVVTYLAAGGLGLGVFSGGGSGLSTLTGATAGYLLGFVVAAAAVGGLAQRGWDRTLPGMAAAMALGSVVIYACGVANLLRFLPDLPSALAVGVWPFLLGDALKLSLAVVLVPSVHRLLGRRP